MFSPTPAYLRSIFDYDPTTGELTRKGKTPGRKPKPREELAGRRHRTVTIMGRGFKAHRIIWTLVYGRMPARSVDHINGDPLDNRLGNLREASHAENMRNMNVCRNATGFKGVRKVGQKYQAQIRFQGKSHYLGMHGTPEEAARAYDAAALEHFGEFACTNEDLGLYAA